MTKKIPSPIGEITEAEYKERYGEIPAYTWEKDSTDITQPEGIEVIATIRPPEIRE